MELNFITLEDNFNYAIIDTIEVNNNRYLYLARENDPYMITVRKVTRDEGREYLVKLDDDIEYESVMDSYHDLKEGE